MLIRSLREFKHNYTYLTGLVGKENATLYITNNKIPYMKVCRPNDKEIEEMKWQLENEKKNYREDS